VEAGADGVDPAQLPIGEEQLNAGLRQAIQDRRREAIGAGAGRSVVRLEANGLWAKLDFQQESHAFDWSVIRCLAALARVRGEDNRYFHVSYAELITIGYLPHHQIEMLRSLVRLSVLPSRLPLATYTVRPLRAG
jgi:hypothetical protein